MTTQTLTLKGRTYSFTTEGARGRKALTTLGILTNSRGEFAGYVNRVNATGALSIMGGPQVSIREERVALASLQLV